MDNEEIKKPEGEVVTPEEVAPEAIPEAEKEPTPEELAKVEEEVVADGADEEAPEIVEVVG